MSPRKAAAKYGPDGKYYRKRLKGPDGKAVDVYGRTQAELAEKVTLIRNRLAAGTVPPQEMYFFEYAAGFYARREPHMSPGARKMYKYQINSVICPVIGGKRIRDVTSDDLAAVLATRAHLSRSSQQKTVLVLKQIFDAAREADVIEKLPTRRLRPGGKTPAPKKALTEAQQAALLDAVRGLSVEPCVMLGLYTGMRREEICALKWDAVELEGRAPHLTVRRACRWPDNNRPEISDVLKTDAAARVIPLPPPLAAYLRNLKAARLADLQNEPPSPSLVIASRCAHRRGNPSPSAPLQPTQSCHPERSEGSSSQPVTPAQAAARLRSRCVYGDADGAPLTFTTWRRRWESIRTRSTASGHALGEKVRNKKYSITLDFYPTPHQLRHTYITRLILGGMDLKRVQYLAGHADPKVTLQIYTDLMGHAPEDLIDDVTAIFSK